MKRTAILVFAIVSLVGCSSGDTVKVHRPLGGFPDEPSTVIAVVNSINESQGFMRVNVTSVDGEARRSGDTVWIDEKTIFTNSGGGPSLSSWTDLVGAELEIKGWYREDRYYADEVDVRSLKDAVERSIQPSPAPGFGSPTRPTPRPTP